MKRPPKPWRNRVLVRQDRKWRKRKSWTRARWARYVEERDARRNQRGILRTLKSQRMRELARRADSEARSQRMLAYHAKRRAAAAE